ncbi:hypothetical protein PLICBS_003891 [Purpureocillium lilacinum]|uniref:uncharacterized protein n=1 Tax=Purpureocillium lilacinum TaxID=33203 RepID=UPI0020803BC4|nr:hypothetical protein PLICBS_003891 [Purpureocillium lilacinum]
MTPSKSAGSFPATRGTTAGFGLSLRQVPSALTSGDSSSARSTASGVDRASMVAERRRFFEGPQAGKVSSSSTSFHHGPADTKASLRTASSWQTLRTASPPPSSRSNCTVLQHTPASNARKQSTYNLPTATCSSLPDSLSVSSTTRLIGDAQPTDHQTAFMPPPQQPGTSHQRPETPGRTSDKGVAGALKHRPREVITAIAKTPVGGTARKLHNPVVAATPALRTARAHSPTFASLQKRFDSARQSTSAPSLWKKRQDPSAHEQLAGTRSSYLSIPESDRGPWASGEQQEQFHDKRSNPMHDNEPAANQPGLRDAIDLFESLGRHAGAGAYTQGSQHPASIAHGAERLEWTNLARNRVGATLRKLSGPWRRSRLGSHAAKTRLASDKHRTARPSTSTSNDGSVADFQGASQTNLIDAVTFDFDDDFCRPAPSLPSEPGSDPEMHPVHGSSDLKMLSHSKISDAQPHHANGKRAPDSDTDAETKRAESWIQSTQQPERLVSSRRWMSRSSGAGTMVARVQCALQQPRPVRANEVKRLVSLCKDKVTGWKGRSQTE